MAKYKIFGTTSKELTLPTTKPETSLDFVNSQCIDPSYTFTRNSSGTYVGDDGLIKTAAVNEPRFEFDVLSGEYKGLLIEEARTNQLTYSNTFDVAWTDTNITRESTDNLAPDGTNTALRVLAAQDNATIIRNSAIGSNNTRTFSIFLRRVNGSGAIQFTVNGGSSWNTISQPITSTWSRILIFTNFTNHRVGLRLTTAGDSIELWGSQLEIGPSMTSYIPTTTSTVTRQPDQLVLNRTLNPQGAFYIESNITLGTSLVADNGSSTISPPQGTKSALFYNTSRTLFMSSSITPVEGNYNVPQNLNRVSLGFNRLNNTSYINGHLKKFMYYGSPVTEDNLRSLTGNTRSTFRSDIGEPIVIDGLVLYLDAGNPASYPGSGTIWSDLSGNGNNGTLVNGVGYNIGNLGSLVFDGVDDRGTFTSPITSSSPQSYEVWVKAIPSPTASGGFGYILHNNSATNFIGDAYMGIGYAGSTLQTREIFAFFNGAWNNMGTGVIGNTTTVRQIVLTWNGSSQIAYVDGTQRVSQALTTTPSNFSTTTSFGDFRDSTFRPIVGDIYSIKIYNRALIASEIQQNFIATRSRFGI
jgi:hypothetical protein